MILVGLQVIAEKEYLLVIQTEGLLPCFGTEVVGGQSAQDKFVGRSSQPTGDPMAIAANVFPNVERSVHQWAGLYVVHLLIGERDIASHLPQNRGMAGADLIVHHQLLTNLANRSSDHFKIGTAAHPRRTQHRTQQTIPQDVLQHVLTPTAWCQRITKPTDFPTHFERVIGDFIDQCPGLPVFIHRHLLLTVAGVHEASAFHRRYTKRRLVASARCGSIERARSIWYPHLQPDRPQGSSSTCSST